MTRYLTVAEVIELHRSILERMGSAPEPLRDEGLLESALMRARTAAYYEDADLIAQAVMMVVGISQNQPFVDGNKRAAFAVLDVFLRINGMVYMGEPLELARRIVRVAEQREDRSNEIVSLIDWLRSQVQPV